jgi:twitching motility protein PilT
MDPDETPRLREVIFEGGYYGMQTFDQALLKHYKDGAVSFEDALRMASKPHDFKLLVASDGRTSTSMDDLEDTFQRSDDIDGERTPEVAVPSASSSSAAPPGTLG